MLHCLALLAAYGPFSNLNGMLALSELQIDVVSSSRAASSNLDI